VAVEADFEFFRFLFRSNVFAGPVLEIGGRSWQGEAGNLDAVCRELDIEWEAADMTAGPGVTLEIDILDSATVLAVEKRWPTIALFNLLEHVYDPILALRNSMHLLTDGGVCIVAGPAVWQIHRFPADFWRPLPDFFIEFGRREGFIVPVEMMHWLVDGAIWPCQELSTNGEAILPSVDHSRELWGASKAMRSRVIHRLFDTYGRRAVFPFSGLGLVILKGAGTT